MQSKHLITLALSLATVAEGALPQELIEQPYKIQTDKKLIDAYNCYVFSNFSINIGFFAVFNGVLGALKRLEENRFHGLYVDLNTGFYFDPAVGPNWWEYYFEPVSEQMKHWKYKKIISKKEQYQCYFSAFKLTRGEAGKLIQKYIKVKPHIQDKVNAFVAKNFTGHYTIAIHYRGTDKNIAEARRVAYEEVEEILKEKISNLSPSVRESLQLFIATDESPFIDFMKTAFDLPIICTDSKRSSNGLPNHLDGTFYSSNYQKGEDALIDCLLLSRANELIRTESNLSLIAERFNTEIPVHLIR